MSTHQMGPCTSTYTVALDGEAAQFSWLRRMKIAIGITQSLRYLHTESRPPFAISELKSNSVYVTEDFTPKADDVVY
uniref:Protein kinase domain-containing protein n=1 Tax=Aegilops tauschii subsp. strangulata TaxID=200361 RepID=A0A452Y535_AEGTS